MLRHLLLSVVVLLLLELDRVSAGTITSPKVGSLDALTIVYTPDPSGTSYTGEMTITASTTTGVPSVADRDLKVVLYVATGNGQNLSYAAYMRLPQGATSATAKLLYSQPSQYFSWVVDLYEDDRTIAFPKPAPSFANNQFTYKQLDIVSPTKPNPVFTATVPLKQNNQNPVNQNFGGGVAVANSSYSLSEPLPNASSDWRRYSSFDMVAIEHSQLLLASDAQVNALETYVLSGGFLIVHSIVPDIFEVGSSDSKKDESIRKSLDDIFGLATSNGSKTADARWQSTGATTGSVRPHGGGYILAVNDKPTGDVRALLTNSNYYPISEYAAYGEADYHWFWRNMVLTVGKTPIWGFIAFVVLFVSCAGPLLLRLTTVLKHRTLLLFLIPVFALVATILVLVYNVVREGFGTRGRIAALQFYDNNSESGFTWSRQSYFSGAPPRAGLKFAEGALVRPLVVNWNQAGYYYMGTDPRKQVEGEVSDLDNEILVSNWLVPRSQQMLMVGQRTDGIRLPFAVKQVSDTTIAVTNLSTTPIAGLALRQSADSGYFVEDLLAGETRELNAQPLAEIDKDVQIFVGDKTPRAPAEIDTTNMRFFRYMYNVNRNSDPLDDRLRRLGGSRLSDFGFILVRHQTPEIPLPFDSSIYSEEKHFHLMTGVCPW